MCPMDLLSVLSRLKGFTHGSMRTRLAQAILTYCLTPQSTIGISPSEQLLGQCPRPTLDCLKSHTTERLKETRGNRKSNVISDPERGFETGDDGFVQNYHHGDKRLPGVIQQKTGPVSYQVKLNSGKDRCYHQDQIHKCSNDIP